MIDGSLVRISDPELAREIEKARMRLLLDQSSLAAAVMRIPVVQVHSDQLPSGIGIATGAVIVSQALRLRKIGEIGYAYAHNVVHALFEHLERRGPRDPQRWGVAIDVATAALLDPLLDPAIRNEPAECDTRPTHSAEFNQLVLSLGHLSCEQIYDRLPVPLQAGAGAPSRFEGDPGQSGHAMELQTHLASAVDAQLPDSMRLSSDELAGIAQEVSEAIREATGAGRRPGTSPGFWIESAKRARARRVPWERLFAERMEGMVPMDFRSYPFARRHLWRGVYLPSIGAVGVGRILFAIDTSGSMSLALLGMVVDQIDQLRQATGCSLSIVHFDTRIARVREFTEVDDPITSDALDMPGRGGTDIRAPFEHANARMLSGDRFAGIVVATDGFGPLPEVAPPVPVIWLLPSAWASNFAPAFGSVIGVEAAPGAQRGGTTAGGGHAA